MMGRRGALRLVFAGAAIAVAALILADPLIGALYPPFGYPTGWRKLLVELLADRWLVAGGILLALLGGYFLSQKPHG